MNPALQPDAADARPSRQLPAPPALTVICLCADWCGSCREFASTFDALAAAQPGDVFRWLDIEDEPELVGDLDITTFPTLIVASSHGLHFGGEVLPQGGLVARLVASVRAAPLSSSTLSEELRGQYLQVYRAVAGQPE
ncbi:MAG: thioredoxin family protein [Rubrivivax sp.]